jgi:hypothetical protein
MEEVSIPQKRQSRRRENEDALETIQDWLPKFWTPLPDVWPSVPEIRKQIQATPEYGTLELLGVPQIGNWKGLSLTDVVDCFIKRVCDTIEERWTIRECHKLPAVAELMVAHKIATQNCDPTSNQYVRNFPEGVLPPENLIFYKDADVFQKWFYNFLQNRISQSLYAEHRVFSLEELDIMVPHVDSPDFSRERIMLRYLEEMETLKPRGEDWGAKIVMLREILGMH